jgi:Holliday junction resolvase
MIYAKKVDANHSLIVKTLRELGCSVFDTSSVGRGFPDLVVSKGATALVEVKANAKSPYTKSQLEFLKNWQGTVCRIHDVEGAINLAKTLEKS